MSDITPTARQGSAVARRSWILAVLIAGVGGGLSVWGFHQRALLESRGMEAEFQQEADMLRQAAESEIRLFLEVLDSIRVLHTLSERISDEDFEEFVRKGMLHQQRVLGAFGFVQRIRHELRAPLETSPDAGGRPAIALVEPDGHGGYLAAAEREEYFVLTYQTSSQDLGLPIGYDFSSWPPAVRAIALMQGQEGPALGGMGLPASTGEPLRWYMFYPIYYGGVDGVLFPPPGWLAGFVVALFRPEEVLNRVLQGVPAGRFELEWRETEPGRPPADPMTFAARIPVADREWWLLCRPGPAYARHRGPRPSVLLLAAGLGLTALISWQLAAVGRRARQIEKLVRVRTADLREAHERIAREMDERMRLEDEIHSTAAREQQRVGRDLHDSLGQKLTGAVFLSRGLLRQMEADGAKAKDTAQQLNETLKEAVTEVRRMASGLVPVAVGEDGLADALRRLADESRQTFGVACAFHQAGSRLPDGATAEQLYYIAREAVHNAARHAQPRRIQIDLTEEGGRWQLAVEDDGRGMPADAEQQGGLGLRIMRHRAATVRAGIEFTSPPGGGTRMVCRPLS